MGTATGGDRLTGLALIASYLTHVPAWYLSTAEVTADGGAQPHVRPFSFAEVEGGRLWFCTAKTKDVYRELEANPRFELTAWRPGHGWVVMRGEADLCDRVSEGLRERGYEHMTGLGESYEGPHDPRLTFFTVRGAQAWVCDIDGSWDPVEL